MKSGRGRIFYALIFILLPALLLGVALRSVMQDYLKNNTYQRLDNHAQVISRLASAYHLEDAVSDMQFVINLDLTSQVSQADALICDENGAIIQCSDPAKTCTHRGLSVGQDYLQRVIASGGARDMGLIGSLYGESRYIVAQPIYAPDTGAAIGIAIVSTPVSATAGQLNWICNVYVLVSLLLLLLAAVCMNFFSRQHEHPLREMAKTAAAFGHGDMTARVRLSGRYPEEVEELALSINNMADSLQKADYSRQEFVANVSHELKTPMTTISGYVDGILDGTIPKELERKYMQIVSDETKRLSRLVRSMLDISQLQSEGGIPEEKMHRFDM